jgi:hypothetical protein
VGGGSATGAVDRGREAAEAADDGGQELWRSSSKASRSGRRKRSKMGVCECNNEFVGSSGMYFKLKRRHDGRELLLASSAARVAARAVAARRGGVRRGQQRSESGGRGCWRARGAK